MIVRKGDTGIIPTFVIYFTTIANTYPPIFDQQANSTSQQNNMSSDQFL